MCRISDSYLTCGHFYPSNVISRGLPIFGSFCKLLRNVVTETFAEPSANWEVSSSRILTGTIRGSSCSFICVKLVIHYLTCGFRPVISTPQNVISRGLPIFGSFYKPLRNVVTETLAESSENWKVSSNGILRGRPSGSFINVKLVIHYLMYGFPTFQFYLLTCEVTRAPKPSNKNIPVVFTSSTNNGDLERGFDFFGLMTLLLTTLTL